VVVTKSGKDHLVQIYWKCSRIANELRINVRWPSHVRFRCEIDQIFISFGSSHFSEGIPLLRLASEYTVIYVAAIGLGWIVGDLADTSPL
jgi:hypothetical protein